MNKYKNNVNVDRYKRASPEQEGEGVAYEVLRQELGETNVEQKPDRHEPKARIASQVFRSTLTWLCAVALLVFIQWLSQAHRRDFDAVGGDESAHFVTSMMVRDYLVKAPGSPPLEFAERFYVSYPRVAFGIWPPLFHLLGGAWFVAAEPSRWSALLLMAMLMGALAILLYWEASQHFSRRWAVASVALFLCLPLTIETSGFFGADPAVSILMFAAALAWTRYLVTWETRFAAAFGVLAALALLTKYNALSLVLLPLVSIPLSGQWTLFKRPATWLPAGIVLLVAGPWYVIAWNLVKYAAEGVPPSRWTAFQENVVAVGASLGAGLLITAAASVIRPVGPHATWRISLFSFILSTLLFHSCVYPFSQDRYFLSCLPAAVLLAISGFIRISNSSIGGRWPAILAAASVLLFLGASLSREWDRYRGLREVAEYVNALPPSPGRRVLISSTAAGEGALFAEIALRETRPDSFVLGGSKMLASSTWQAEHYRMLYQTASQLLPALDELRVDYVVLDDFGKMPHDRLAREAIPAATGEWSLVKTFFRRQPASDILRQFSVYRRIGPYVRPARKLEVDLFYTLGRSVSVAGSQTQILFSK